MPGYPVDGKTVTTEVGPADTGHILIAVISEYSGGGGTVATPIAQKVLSHALPIVTGKH